MRKGAAATGSGFTPPGAAIYPPHGASVPSVPPRIPRAARGVGSGGACRDWRRVPLSAWPPGGEAFGTYRNKSGRCSAGAEIHFRSVRIASGGSWWHHTPVSLRETSLFSAFLALYIRYIMRRSTCKPLKNKGLRAGFLVPGGGVGGGKFRLFSLDVRLQFLHRCGFKPNVPLPTLGKAVNVGRFGAIHKRGEA